jgi:hypothetical protein
MTTIEVPLHFARRGRGGRVEASDTPVSVLEAPRIPRVSRLMALAIRFDLMLRDGVVRDQADLARVGGVTRAHITQIMNLLHLAPDIQEELLFMTYACGRDPVILRDLQPISQTLCWAKQREMWKKLRADGGQPSSGS